MISTVEKRPCPVLEHAERTPDLVAIGLADGQSVSYLALHEHAQTAVAGLQALGLTSGSRLAIHARAGLDLIALLVACFRTGVIAAPISRRLPPASINAECTAIGAQAIVVENPLDLNPSIRQLPLRDVWNQHAPSTHPAEISWDLDAPATIIFTSGSTGASKPVLHSLGNHVFNAEGSRANISLELGDRWLLVLPLYHVGGLAIVMRCLLAGATVVLQPAGESLAESIERLHPTHLSLVGTQLLRLLDGGAVPGAHHLKTVLLGGSAIEPNLIDRALENGLPVHTSYGMSEMGSQITTTPPEADRSALATSGRLLPYRELKIDDDRILVRGRTRFLGYVRGDELEQPFDSGGWYRTGDTGYFDEEDRLVVAGREDDMFISGGENIQPGRIERALASLPGILSAVVVPIPDAEFGSLPVAFLRKASVVRIDDIEQQLRRILPGYMVPVAWFALPDDPAESLKRSRSALTSLARQLVRRDSR